MYKKKVIDYVLIAIIGLIIFGILTKFTALGNIKIFTFIGVGVGLYFIYQKTQFRSLSDFITI